MKRSIKTRAEVNELVNDFYAKIRMHEMLGPIFNETVENWDEHLDKLTDFWESILLGANNFEGNPMRAHFQVDAKNKHSISQVHFGHWLQLWFETIDEKFEGKTADTAKERARNIAHITFMKLFQARNGQLLY